MTLNEQQERVVYHEGGPLLVLACPGSGKTRCITERITYLLDEGVDPKSILAVTFTNKAANEMAERVKKRGYGHNLLICTFHSLCVRILRKCGHIAGYKNNFTICDDPESLMRKIIKSKGHSPKDEFDPARLSSILESKKNKLLSDEEFEYGLDKAYIEIFKEYEKTLKISNSLDFSDLIYQTVLIFRQSPAIYKAYAARYKHILVDEMQDTNVAQLELIKFLSSHYKNIISVGDGDQSIYQFRNACLDNIIRFNDHFENSQIAFLSTNYRSTSEILSVSEKLINRNKNRKMIPLKASRGSGHAVELLEHPNPELESEEISNLIYGLKRNHNLKEIAILCRMNSMTRVFEECFRRREIPYTLIGAFGFYDRREVKTGISYMKFLANQEDAIALSEIINEPSRGIGPATVVKVLEQAIQNNLAFIDVFKNPDIKGVTSKAKDSMVKFADVLNKYDKSKPSESLAEIFEKTGFLPYIREMDKKTNEHREDNVLELLRAFDNYCKRKTNPSIEQYLQEIMLITSSDKEAPDDSVRIMTIHAAKGLEFEVVFIPGMVEGIFPHYRSLRDGDVAEERRVCYVACTRAKDRLFLSKPGVKFEDGNIVSTMPSRFLEDMGLIKIDWDKGYVF